MSIAGLNGVCELAVRRERLFYAVELGRCRAGKQTRLCCTAQQRVDLIEIESQFPGELCCRHADDACNLPGFGKVFLHGINWMEFFWCNCKKKPN